MDIKEFEIPVPWGHVAVKAWGNEANTPILVVHGLGDNVGSFDRLIPRLPTSFYYICIDLPSHGKSSHYPPYLLISALDNLLTMKMVVDYLDRKTYIIMGHSWGGQTAMLFTQLFPENVLKLILLDAFYLAPVGEGNFQNHLVERFDTIVRINENMAKRKKPPSYTFEEAVERLISNRMWGDISKEAAEALIKRSLIPTEDGKFRFCMDPRLRAFLNPLFDMDFTVKLMKKYPITCPILFVPASESEDLNYVFKQFIKELKRRNKKCVIKKVRGSHDVHNNNPEIVAPIVNNFLLDVKSKL